MDEWDQLLELASLEAGLAGVADGDDAANGVGPWVGLAAAEADTGVSRSALRAWYRSGELASRVVDGPHGPQRLVPIDAVRERARLSPRIQRKVARPAATEAEVAALRDRVADLERRLARLESGHQ